VFVRLENTPRDYAWGSTTAIAELVGRKPSGSPEAELWLGTHAGSPTRIADPAQVGGYETLAQWVAAEPELTLGKASAGGQPALGFLLKLLAAAHPLSLQSHPSIAQAEEGYAREDAAGIPVTAANRNYKDRNHKPELIVALSPTFEALCGFRPTGDVLRVLQEFTKAGSAKGLAVDALADFSQELLRCLESRGEESAISWALTWLLTGADGVQKLVEQFVILANATTTPPAESATVRELAAEYPGDPGIVLALLLNRVSLKRGEALYLPAGNMHAYLSGLGVELMAASDNVLRGGLTPKHIDVAELVAVTQCQPLAVPALSPLVLAAGVHQFAPGVPDFALLQLSLDDALNGGHAAVTFDGPAILICTAGEISLVGQQSSGVMQRGDFFFVTPDEGVVNFHGFGEIFAARQGLSPDSAT